MNNNNKNKNIPLPVFVSNSYLKKYYIDSQLESLPESVKNEIKILLVKLTEEVGGVATISYDNENFELVFEIIKNDDDIAFDSINANYKISKLERDNKELFDGIATFCKFKLNGIV